MDDYLEENPIIIGLQIFIFVFLVIAFIALSWNCYNNTRIRAVYKATLPDHLPYLKNPQIPTLSDQVVNNDSTSTKKATNMFMRKRNEDSNKKKNYLPPGLAQYSTKSSVSTNEEIIKNSNSIFSQLQENTQTKEKVEIESALTQPKGIRTSDIFRSIQTDGAKRVQDEKEKAKKKKKEEEDKKKQLELEKQKEEKTDTSKPASKFNFNFSNKK